MNLNLLDTKNGNIYDTLTSKLLGNGGSKYMFLFVITIVIIIYYFLFSGIKEQANIIGENSVGLSILELLLWGTLVFLLLINGLKYFLNIDIKTSINNLLSPEPEINIAIIQDKLEKEKIPEPKKEVFHVSDNVYTYDDAKAVCKAFDSRIATYDEIEESYENGGEWCNYGWSKDQLALYPTQKQTYEKLQKIKGEEHSCGRPGVNGGYIANSNVKFGVNCYGYKPKITNNELKQMEKMKVEPVTKEERELDKKVNEYKSKLNEILLSPFNNNRWAQF
jgi:hypothetical protein